MSELLFNLKSFVDTYFYNKSRDRYNLYEFLKDNIDYNNGVLYLEEKTNTIFQSLSIVDNVSYWTADDTYYWYLRISYSNASSKQLEDIQLSVQGNSLTVDYDSNYIYVEGLSKTNSLTVTLPKVKVGKVTYQGAFVTHTINKSSGVFEV